jgi:(p)ppGpp synthase/HD superfamily hydrolase
MSPRFNEALVYAAELHATQEKKVSKVPYIAHLLGVTAIALEYGADDDEAIAALLHDAVEDQGGQATAREIRRRFGERVVEIVLGCTDSDTTPKPPWRERKERYIAHLDSGNPSIFLVSASDKLYNARSIVADYRRVGEVLWDRFNGKREGTLWYYRTLADKFNGFAQEQRLSKDLADELERTVQEMERLANAT